MTKRKLALTYSLRFGSKAWVGCSPSGRRNTRPTIGERALLSLVYLAQPLGMFLRFSGVRITTQKADCHIYFTQVAASNSPSSSTETGQNSTTDGSRRQVKKCADCKGSGWVLGWHDLIPNMPATKECGRCYGTGFDSTK